MQGKIKLPKKKLLEPTHKNPPPHFRSGGAGASVLLFASHFLYCPSTRALGLGARHTKHPCSFLSTQLITQNSQPLYKVVPLKVFFDFFFFFVFLQTMNGNQ